MAQTISTSSGEEFVLLSCAEYERLIALAAETEEDTADVPAHDAAFAEIAAGGGSIMPAEVSASLLRGACLLTLIREWRGV